MSEPTTWSIIRTALRDASEVGQRPIPYEEHSAILDELARNVDDMLTRRAASPAVPAPTPEREDGEWLAKILDERCKCEPDQQSVCDWCQGAAMIRRLALPPALPASAPTPLGYRIVADESVPVGVVEFRDSNGELIGEFDGRPLTRKGAQIWVAPARIPIAPIPELVPRQKEVEVEESGSAGASPEPTRLLVEKMRRSFVGDPKAPQSIQATAYSSTDAAHKAGYDNGFKVGVDMLADAILAAGYRDGAGGGNG